MSNNLDKAEEPLSLGKSWGAAATVNAIWRAMVAGFQATDPTLAAQWGVHKPAGFVSSTTGNPGLSMYCQNSEISILVEYNTETALYLLSYKKDGQDNIEPLATVLSPEAIAPAIIAFMKPTSNI